MSGIMSQQLMDDNKFNRIEEATQLLQLKLRDLTIEQLLTIWMMETTSWFKFQVPDTNGPDPSKLITKYTRNPAGLDNEKLEQVNNPNHAFRAIAWPGSKVLTLLGLESGETCTFLNSDRIQKIVSIAAESDHPHQRLAEMVFNSTLHGKEQKDEDGQDIHGWQCKYCATTLQTALVRQVRSDRQHAENQFVATMIKTLNA